MSMGNNFEVIEPKSMKETLVEEINEMLKTYSQL